MKTRIPTFLAGMFTMLLLGTLTISALAISGNMTIEVSPINIQIDGEIFQPKDANGNDVPVFVYNGTTYAPLRALAEAYGLEVGYDATANMATVTNPSKALNSAAQSENPNESFLLPEDSEAWNVLTYEEFKNTWNYMGKVDDELMKTFTNPHIWAGVEVDTMKTDIYNFDITGKRLPKEAGHSSTQHRDYFEKNIVPVLEKYASQMCNELHTEGRNTIIGFYFGQFTQPYICMITANGNIATENPCKS